MIAKPGQPYYGLSEVKSFAQLREWANGVMSLAGVGDFYSAEVFSANCTRSARKDAFWEVESADMGANRADSGSTSFWVEWACYVAANWGAAAVVHAGRVQGNHAAQSAVLVPLFQEAASRINALVQND